MRKNIYTKLILTGIGALSCVAGAAWLASSRMESSTDHRLSVSATFYPIAFLAEQIGGDRVSVRTVVPPGIEPHDFDPSLRDIAGIYASKLFLVGGAGVDRFAERLEDDLSRKGVRVVILSDSVDLLSAAEDEAGQPVPIGTRDPHFWLDPAEYEKGASAVMRALVDADPAHASVYRTNFDRLKENLDELDMRFRTISTSACRQDTVVVSHNAFSYLARRYGFTVRSLVGIDPSQEVSVGTLSDVIRFMQEKQIRD
jgi:zinc transport system substrate-binding protein